MFQNDQSKSMGVNPYESVNPYEIKSDSSAPPNPYEDFQQQQSGYGIKMSYGNNNTYGDFEQEQKSNNPYEFYQKQQSEEQMTYNPEESEERLVESKTRGR